MSRLSTGSNITVGSATSAFYQASRAVGKAAAALRSLASLLGSSGPAADYDTAMTDIPDSSNSDGVEISTPARTLNRDTSVGRSQMTDEEANQIRNLHDLQLCELRDRFWDAIPLVRYEGASPCTSASNSPRSSRPMTPTWPAEESIAEAEVQRLCDAQLSIPTAEEVPGVFIDPYATEPIRLNVDDADTVMGSFPAEALDNSGVCVMTDYPLSTSPRQSSPAIQRRLKDISRGYRERKEIGQALHRKEYTMVNVGAAPFAPFSYVNASQPRTELARSTAGEPISPKTKSTQVKR